MILDVKFSKRTPCCGVKTPLATKGVDAPDLLVLWDIFFSYEIKDFILFKMYGWIEGMHKSYDGRD